MSVPSWLSAPVAPPSSPPPASETAWAGLKAKHLGQIAAELALLSVEPGDAAHDARVLALAAQAAMLDHPRHGRNWWARHGTELLRALRPFLTPAPPVDSVEIPLEGAALHARLTGLFPGGASGHRERSHLDDYYSRETTTSRDAASGTPAREQEPKSEARGF